MLGEYGECGPMLAPAARAVGQHRQISLPDLPLQPPADAPDLDPGLVDHRAGVDGGDAQDAGDLTRPDPDVPSVVPLARYAHLARDLVEDEHVPRAGVPLVIHVHAESLLRQLLPQLLGTPVGSAGGTEYLDQLGVAVGHLIRSEERRVGK